MEKKKKNRRRNFSKLTHLSNTSSMTKHIIPTPTTVTTTLLKYTSSVCRSFLYIAKYRKKIISIRQISYIILILQKRQGRRANSMAYVYSSKEGQREGIDKKGPTTGI